jgi:hypothetical protein
MRKLILLSLAVPAAIAAALAGHHWYFQRYLWPAEIQSNLLGNQIADSDALIRREGYSAYGEGAFRWYYRVDSRRPELTRLCRGQPSATCRFTKSHKLREGIEQTVYYSNGVLLLEEIWS